MSKKRAIKKQASKVQSSIQIKARVLTVRSHCGVFRTGVSAFRDGLILVKNNRKSPVIVKI
jgi:hypothetical protein